MADFKGLFQSADWKTEKHAPVIEAPDTIEKGETFRITVTVGKEIAHPNKTEHHIRWITAYFQPEGDKFPYQIGKAEFTAHGESVNGPDTSAIYTDPQTTLNFKTDRSGTIYAASYCNIHGLWQGQKEVTVK